MDPATSGAPSEQLAYTFLGIKTEALREKKLYFIFPIHLLLPKVLC